jgi:tetratricopeptide (TPR) repeat protein
LRKAWILLAGAFVLKLVVLLQLKAHPLLQPDTGLDTAAYAELARRVVAGDLGLGPGLYYVSPLYIYFLAAVLWITDSFTAVRLLQILLGTGSIAFIYLSARAWFNERAALIAAGLAAFTGLFTFYEVLILQAALDAFMTSAALLCLTYALKRVGSGDGGLPRRSFSEGGWLLAAGIIFGLATLNRPNMGLALVGIAAATIVARRFRPAAVLVAGLLIGMAPSAIRNVVVAGQWSFAASHGGLNFYIGNNENATGFYRQVPGISPNIAGQQKDARRVAEKALGRQLSEAETSDYFFGLAWSWIREHPGRAARLFALKLGYTFHAQHIALPYSYPFYAHDAGTVLRFYAIGPWLLVPLGLIGLLFAAPRTERTNYLIWLSFVPAYAVGVAAFFVAERYRLPLLVPLSIGAGAAIDAAWTTLRAGRVTALIAPVAALAVLATAINWRHGYEDGRWDEGLRLAEQLVLRGRYDEAEAWVERLRPGAPSPGIPDYIVGRQLMLAKQTPAALAHLERAREADPNEPVVAYVLGQALLQAGRAKDAVPHLTRGVAGGAPVPLLGYDLALALQSVGDLPAAARVIARITPSDEDGVEVWLRLGRLAAEVKAPEVATPFFLRAAVMRPSLASARQQLGLNLLVLERFEEAARELSEAVDLDPRNADSLAHLAYCELKLGRLADARTHTEAALAVSPDHPLGSQLRSILRTRGSSI